MTAKSNRKKIMVHMLKFNSVSASPQIWSLKLDRKCSGRRHPNSEGMFKGHTLFVPDGALVPTLMFLMLSESVM